jgi:hypothetical protein
VIIITLIDNLFIRQVPISFLRMAKEIEHENNGTKAEKE